MDYDVNDKISGMYHVVAPAILGCTKPEGCRRGMRLPAPSPALVPNTSLDEHIYELAFIYPGQYRFSLNVLRRFETGDRRDERG